MSKFNRHYETLHEIQKRRSALQREKQREIQTGLTRYLDNLNAFGVLEDVQSSPPNKHLYFGPGDIHGTAPEMWAGVVIWFRPPGYHSYRTLTLLGMWARGSITTPEIIIGTRILTFNAPYYNGESYFRTLRTSFAMYYGKDAPPPDEADRLYTADYDPERRLEMRKAVADVVKTWYSAQK